MKVAVLMSTYNGEKYVEEQIDSILEQKGDFQLDLYVRDDGSTDSTQNILRKYEEKEKLKWVSGENVGVAQSFLTLLKENSGYDFYAFSDQDDYWEPDKVRKGIELLEGRDYHPLLYFSNAEIVDSELRSCGRNVYKVSPKIDFYTLTCAGGILGCTMIFNQKLAGYVQSAELPTKIIMHDFYLATLCITVGGKIIFDPLAHMKYRQHEDNVIGISKGFFETLKSRLKNITTRRDVSIADQAKELLPYASEDKRWWLESIKNYRENIISRIRLALSLRTRYININMSIKIRISILLGNR